MSRLSGLPLKLAVYALLSGRGDNKEVAYVGKSENLKRRLDQHIFKKNSSVTTGATAVILDSDKITEILWGRKYDISERQIRRMRKYIREGVNQDHEETEQVLREGTEMKIFSPLKNCSPDVILYYCFISKFKHQSL